MLHARRGKFAHRAPTLMLVSALQLAWSAHSHADENDTLNFTLQREQQYDSNLFRLPDNLDAVIALGGRGRSEQIGVTTAALAFDKSYSLQRLLFNASAVDYRYRNFDYLSFTALNYAAAWQWSLTPRVRGVLSSTRYESPTNYQDFKGFSTRNVHTERATRLEAEADLGGAWRVIGGLDRTDALEEQVSVREGDASVQGAALGLRYVFVSGSSASYRIRRTVGESFGLVGTSSVEPLKFDDRIHELELVWNLSPKTKLSARLGYTDRDYTQAVARGYSGVTGDVTAQWDPTPKSGVEVSFKRTLAPYQTFTSNYISANRFAISPVWKATSQIKVRARYEVTLRDFEGIAPGSISGFQRSDIYRAYSLGVDWQPVRSATISLTLNTISNSSNVYGGGYKSNGARIAGQFTF